MLCGRTYATDVCRTETPQLREISPKRFVSCHRAEELDLAGVVTSGNSMTLTRTSFPRIAPHIGKRRLRLVICLGLYGSALGASSLLVSFMARTRYPIEPEYLQFVPSVILSGGG